jgi:hypothetical protein
LMNHLVISPATSLRDLHVTKRLRIRILAHGAMVPSALRSSLSVSLVLTDLVLALG